MFEPAILPHLPPALLRYKSLPSPVYAGVYTALLIRCALSMVTAVCVRTAVCTQLSLCVAHTCVAQQYSCVFACVGYAYVFETAMLPHLPPAFLGYKSLPSHVNAYVFEPAIHTTSPSSAPAVQIPSITCECRCVHGTAYTLRTQHGHSSVYVQRCAHSSRCV